MQEPLFTMSKLDDVVPSDHPLRSIQVLVDEALRKLSGLFNETYADTGRSSIAPEKLMRALLLQVFYSVRSERPVCEQLRYNLLFRWFVGLAIDDAVWDHSVFSKNRDRLLEHAVVEAFFRQVMVLADAKGLLSREHFSVDGTLIQAWAKPQAFGPRMEAMIKRLRARGAMRRPTGVASRAPTTRTRAAPIRTRGCFARAPTRPPFFATRDTC